MPALNRMFLLTGTDGKNSYFLEDAITGVHMESTTHSVIYLDGGKVVRVKEPPEAIVAEMSKSYDIIDLRGKGAKG